MDNNNFNTIKAHHYRMVDGDMKVDPRDYYWHIPKNLRGENIKKGDIVIVQCRGRKAKVVVSDVFREEFEEAKKKYKSIVAKVNFKEPVSKAER